MNTIKNTFNIVIFYTLTLNFALLNGQNGSGNVCTYAEPICGSSQFSYPNISGINFGEVGPYYGCLTAQLNPSWFYFQIAKDGGIRFKIEQSTEREGLPNLDVDFILYGPFNSPRLPCTSELISENIVDCSYATDFVEYVDINTSKAGEYYLLLITNFSLKSGFINITQVSGSGTTNCTLLKEPIISDNVACKGSSLSLNALTTNSTYYKWYEADSIGSTLYNEILGFNDSFYKASKTNTYRADVFDENNVLIEKYQFNVEFLQTPKVPENIINYEICDDIDKNNLYEFDLSLKNAEVLNNLDPLKFEVSYYRTFNDALSKTNALSQFYNSEFKSETIYVRIDNTSSSALTCFDIGSFNIKVNVLPEFNIEESYILCTNTNGTETITTPPIIDTGLNEKDYTFVWWKNDTELPDVGSFYIPNEKGFYGVQVYEKSTGCSQIKVTEVNLSAPPVVSASVASLTFIEKNKIIVGATGLGFQEYEFKIDDKPWQRNNIFTNINFGEHTIKARDLNGCGVSSITIMVIDYPLYFTPNGDGVNDFWNIVGITSQFQAKISIYNRYGKLITQINHESLGWDGTLNGLALPSDDYWFTVNYLEPIDNKLRTFKAHFSLKR